MRACFVVHDAAWSGATRAFADAATLLAARGYETCCVAPAGSDAERGLAASGHEVISMSGGGGWLRAGWRLRRVVASRLSEVLFVHGDREHLVAATAIRLAGRGAVVRRTPSAERLTLGGDGRLAMRLASTAFVFAHADDLHGMTPPRGALAAHVAPPGVVAATQRPPVAVGGIGRDAVQRMVIMVGADRRREALVALRALALLAPRLPALRATVFWPAADLDVARLEAAALGVADRIDWCASGVPQGAAQGAAQGAEQGAKRSAALGSADVAWVIATADDAVFAVLDSFAHGVPVLAEHSPVMARIIEDGVTGVLRHRMAEAEWASVVAATLARAEPLDAMRAGALRAAARWPLDAGADGWVRVTEAARDRARWIS